MALRKVRNDGSTSDLEFKWIIEDLGGEWELWQKLAISWISKHHEGVAPRLWALKRFFKDYLFTCAPYTADVPLFFEGDSKHRCSTEELKTTIEKTITSPHEIYRAITLIYQFIEFVVDSRFSQENDEGRLMQLVVNPFTKIKSPSNSIHIETVRNPLPYRYIQYLRQILCPLPNDEELAVISQGLQRNEPLLPSYHYRHFKHWVYDHEDGRGPKGWFEVDPKLIDQTDPDCVWRCKKVIRQVDGKGKKLITIYQMWSPVKAMVIFTKLHLPLRTYQVRLLDSGEADTWRYEHGQWKLNNKHSFALGSEKRPFAKGVFRRIYDTMTGQYSTGLYINTNKTADRNKEEFERGYVIPWQNDEVLYWLEKLRNWQEKYNPIDEPTDCKSLEGKHTGNHKSQKQLGSMGDISFLFRNAAGKGQDRNKPLIVSVIDNFWYELLLTLENKLAEKGDTLENGARLKLVVEYPESVSDLQRRSTLFPMHSLRVSLITSYTMDTKLPLPVISKLLAGHSRLLMTIYYNKITPSVMSKKMNEAELELDEKSQQSVRGFLKDASLEQIKCKMVYHKEESIQAALVNRNPIGWEERSSGLCLVGGNTVKSDEVKTLGGCWNGGELIRETGGEFFYSSVPHGPENCIRCRWFITEARYLPALNAHFNQLSYKAHQAASLSAEIESELDALRDNQFFFEEQGTPFTKHSEMQMLQRRYEKQQVEADEYAKDWVACFELISKIIQVEENRSDEDRKDKYITVGSEYDVGHALKFVETKSELLHLSLLCEDAEFYPDLQDELLKTPAIQKRSMMLSRMLMKKGFEPIFMEMDDRQQLIAANAMFRHMAKIADPEDKLEGFRKVANYIEAGEYLSDNKLFNSGIDAITDKVMRLKRLV